MHPDSTPGDGTTPERTGLPGRKPGDRRVRVSRPETSRYFRYVAPGTLAARATASTDRSRVGRALALARRGVFGRPLSTAEEMGERLTKVKALAVFSSDALSSVAYATEAILFSLVLAGSQFFGLAMPISLVIVGILAIVTISYRQTIRAYPNGGGSYIVAKENLGTIPGLVAAAALLVDYVLTVSVSVASGIANLVSAFPTPLLEHRTILSVLAVVGVTVVNLRGVRESGSVFAIPTYVFVGSTLVLIVVGVSRVALGMPPVVTGVAPIQTAATGLSAILLLRAFADGCSAMTGVEAISNGVPAFRPPESRNARTTLLAMSGLLGVMFIGITFLALAAGAVPAEHETVISQVGRATFGASSVPYFVLLLSTVGILILAANTSFADFPRLSSLLARDRFMPSRFSFRGERLAFSAGIVALAALAILVILAFRARVEALIPLYAVGVFTSFTLSQAGMVVHWRRERGPGWRRSMVVNGVGAVATAIVALIFAVAKFALGAWIVVIVIPVLVAIMLFIGHEYDRGRVELAVRPETLIGPPSRRQRVVIPVSGMRRDVVQAIKFARTMSDEIVAVHISDDLGGAEAVRERFERQVPGVTFVVVESPYRNVVNPLIHYLEATAEDQAELMTIVLLPEYVYRHWWERFLYNSIAHRLRSALIGVPNILVANVPYRMDR